MQIMPGKNTDWVYNPETEEMVRYFVHEVVLEGNETVTAGRLAALLVRYPPQSVIEMGPELISIIEREARGEFPEEREVRMISMALNEETKAAKEARRKASAEALAQVRLNTKLRSLAHSLETNTAVLAEMLKK